ncbi:MAG TPA: hypothetical protein VIW94_08565 [Acidimicrobiia bacterium]
MKRTLLLVASLALIAATPVEVVETLEEQGFYIEPGSGATEAVVGDAVAEAGFAGSRLYVVVLAEEPATSATFFSDGVLDDLGTGTVLTVAPETVGWASMGDIWTDEQLDAALDASLDGGSDDEVVIIFVESLTGTSVGPGSAGGSTGGGGSGWIWFLIIGGGLLVLFFYLRGRSASTAATARDSRLREFYTLAQGKLDSIANDIIEMEDEVSLSANPDVKLHYDSASATYADLIDKVPNATTADDLVDIAYQLDVAIWELDVAEALLDGKTAPEKPERVVLEAAPAEQPIVVPPTSDDFDRRTQRQSSPAGSDLGNILLAILAAQNLGGGRGGTWGQPGGGFPGSGGGFPGGPGGGGGGGTRMRGGGRRRG